MRKGFRGNSLFHRFCLGSFWTRRCVRREWEERVKNRAHIYAFPFLSTKHSLYRWLKPSFPHSHPFTAGSALQAHIHFALALPGLGGRKRFPSFPLPSKSFQGKLTTGESYVCYALLLGLLKRRGKKSVTIFDLLEKFRKRIQWDFSVSLRKGYPQLGFTISLWFAKVDGAECWNLLRLLSREA